MLSSGFFNMDCMDGMKRIVSESIDCIITDPPYKMNRSTGGCTNISMKEKWNGNIKAGNSVMGFDTSIKFSDWLPEAYRVCKNGGHVYVFTNDKNMQELLNEASKAGFVQSNILTWHKNNATPNRYYMKNCEFIVLFYKKPAIPIRNMGSKCVFSYDNINGKNKLHATEKPVGILTPMIENSTEMGETVLDMFMGSASTAVACVRTGRKYIGFEKDAEIYNAALNRLAASERIAKEQATVPLFSPEEIYKPQQQGLDFEDKE